MVDLIAFIIYVFIACVSAKEILRLGVFNVDRIHFLLLSLTLTGLFALVWLNFWSEVPRKRARIIVSNSFKRKLAPAA